MGVFHGTGISMIPARREIPVRGIPGREKFEAIREGGNGNFPLNIFGLAPIFAHICCTTSLMTATAAALHLLRCCMYELRHPAWLLDVTCNTCSLG